MVFAYYHKLSQADQKIYRQSDRIEALRLQGSAAAAPAVAALSAALEQEDRKQTRDACQRIADGIARAFNVPPVRIKVLARRPHNADHELHGLYEDPDDGSTPVITVWMRTAARKQVVAFRTFLRTLLHELCHHLDYTLLKLDDSFHTEGFYKRESSLFQQLTEQA